MKSQGQSQKVLTFGSVYFRRPHCSHALKGEPAQPFGGIHKEVPSLGSTGPGKRTGNHKDEPLEGYPK